MKAKKVALSLLAFALVLISCDQDEKVVENLPPEVSTTVVSQITSFSAVAGGTITHDGGSDVVSKGVCWGVNPNPTTSDSKTNEGGGVGSFTSNLAGLLCNTEYNVRAYAINSAGTAYGNEVSFRTIGAELAAVSTNFVADITHNSAKSGGNITSDGGGEITARGVVWSTSENPTLESNEGYTENGIGVGEFVSEIEGIEVNTQYYVRAYATNSAGNGYGDQEIFTTMQETIFYDDFLNNNNEWLINDYATIADGHYVLSINNPGYYYYCSNYVDNFSFSGNFELEMSVRVDELFSAEYHFFGFAWNIIESPLQYRGIFVYSDGYLWIRDRTPDDWESIYSDFVFGGYSAGDWINLKLKRETNLIKVYINDELVATVSTPADQAISNSFALTFGDITIAVDYITIYGSQNSKVTKHHNGTTMGKIPIGGFDKKPFR